MRLGTRCIDSIAKVFVGDEAGVFPNISGPLIFQFFNERFGFHDEYPWGGAPTRWRHAADCITTLLERGQGDEFFSTILSYRYMMQGYGCGEMEAREKAKNAEAELNRILRSDGFELAKYDGGFRIVEPDKDLVPVGSGGFADVYRRKSTGLIVKKLKEELLLDKGNRHRFKREYQIMKDLVDVPGVLRVYEYDEESCSYTMEEGECTLDAFLNNPLNDTVKTTILQQILLAMDTIHNRGVIHRDISPTNIFILRGKIKIADFGLGKNLETLASYQTCDTRNYGQFLYCSPEQLLYLKDGDKRSDVFALGRLISFVMTGNPMDNVHQFRALVEKATTSDPNNRYQDAGELRRSFERRLEIISNEQYEEAILSKAQRGVLDEDVAEWIYSKAPEALCRAVLEHPWLKDTLVHFAISDGDRAAFVVDSINTAYSKVCKQYEDHDLFSDIAYGILMEKAPFDVKERACGILSHTAWHVNRWHAQGLIKSAIEEGIDPMLEDALKG